MNPDRRGHPRIDMDKPCKVYDPVSRRFAPGRTRNVSRGGVLVEVQWARPLALGDPLDVVIGYSALAVLPVEALMHGRVTRRVASAGEVQLVAIEFDRAQEAAAAA
jgi:PilZ domain